MRVGVRCAGGSRLKCYTLAATAAGYGFGNTCILPAERTKQPIHWLANVTDLEGRGQRQNHVGYMGAAAKSYHTARADWYSAKCLLWRWNCSLVMPVHELLLSFQKVVHFSLN